jgi:hypothetical protein
MGTSLPAASGVDKRQMGKATRRGQDDLSSGGSSPGPPELRKPRISSFATTGYPPAESQILVRRELISVEPAIHGGIADH